MDVNFELYKIFYHTVKEHSFTAAAEKLYITQSAVSQSIRNLETRLGQELFTRKARNVALTREGELLYGYVEQAFNFLKTGESRLEELKNLETGEIRIGAGDTTCKYFLVPYMEQYIRQYPYIKIKVINRTSHQLVEALKNGLLDLCVVTLPVEDPALEITEFKNVNDIFTASNRFSGLKERRVPLKELCTYPLLLLPKESTTRKNLQALLKQHTIELTPEIELESIDLLVDFARIGLGISHVLRESASNAIENGELFEVKTEEELPSRKLGIATIKNTPISRASSEFLRLLTGNT